MSDLSPTDKILSDLPTIQQIALRPQTQNPLLALILQQAQALAEIGNWAASAQQLAGAEAGPPAAPSARQLAGPHAEPVAETVTAAAGRAEAGRMRP